jgi:GntR family transcriptional regulator/MocR family aminotransferase
LFTPVAPLIGFEVYHFDVVRRAGGFALALQPREPGTPAYRWLYGALRAAILDGRLRPRARLPSTRDLADQYGLARGTVVDAFAQLASEGYVDGAVGSGTYVSAVLPDELLEVAAPAGPRRAPPRPPRRHASGFAQRALLFPTPRPRATRAFRSNLPALDQFPIAVWTQLASRRLRRASVRQLMSCEVAGHPPLCRAIADYVAASRGVTCRPEQVFVVPGVQGALDLIARIALDPGDAVAMEQPGYVGAARAFHALGARVIGAPVDDEGMVVDRAQLRGARLVYITPAHQYPLGVTMSLTRRLALLDWAQRHDALVFEDDYDSEYRYSGRPFPALQSLDRAGCVVFAGSFSKVLFPALRLGYLVVPPDLVDRCAAALSLTHRHLPLLEQTVLCDFMVEGHFGRHLRRMRELYAERLAVLTDGVRQRMTGRLELSPVEAGLQTVGWLAPGVAAGDVADAALARDVEVVAMHGVQFGPVPRDGLHLGFAAVSPREIRRGVDELARVLDRLTPSARPAARSAGSAARARPTPRPRGRRRSPARPAPP